MNPSALAITTATPHSVQKLLKKGNWLPAEDEQLREGVAKHGMRWVLVAGEVGTRNGDQCAKRWKDKLSPDLDHSPWTREEENQLLELVDRYGRNWKFMADFYLEARAPLALKNRHALLMRRLKRQGSGSTESTNLEIPAALVIPLHDTAPQTINEIVESANALMEGSASDLVISTSPRISAHSTISFRNGISSAVETITGDFPPPEILGSAQATCKGTAIAWDGESLDWQQLILDSMMDVDGVSDPTMTNPWEVNDTSKLAVVASDAPRPSSWSDSSDSSSSRSALRSQAGSRSSDSRSSVTGSKVKFSVTCERGKLKSVVKHMVDAAMAESADLATEQDQVTLTLQLRG